MSHADGRPSERVSRILQILSRNLLLRPFISVALVALLLVTIFSVIFYVQRTLSEIEEALPITLSKQERELHVLVNNMGMLVHNIGFARANKTPGGFSMVVNQAYEMEQHLENVRENYRFNDVLGVSAIHAKLNPAIYDIKTWMTKGIHNFGPTSAHTLKLAEQRAKQAHEEVEVLLLEAGETAKIALGEQARRIEDFRTIMIVTLVVLTLMTVGLVILGFRLQRIVVALKESEEKIRYRANYDALTHLPNRSNFIEHLTEAITRSHRKPSHIALLFIDLDRFKTINDTLGHDFGDELIRQVAKRIGQAVRETDVVARLGGDEFTVLLTDMLNEIHASIVAKSILARLADPFILDGHEVYSSASIGITVCPQDGDEAHTLLKNADMAMYEAKEQGRNTFCYFTSQMTERASQFLKLDKEMRSALARDELQIHYQPIYATQSTSMMGVEALLRWEHPEKGLVLPVDFINVAEETGLIEEIGQWVLRRACVDARGWLDQDVDENFYLAVNISIRQFKGGFDREQLQSVLYETGFPANRLVLEITESLLMDDDSRIKQVLADFREMGVRLAVDDFGTGYSALSYLREFPVTTLKIDRSFIHEIAHNESDLRLVEAILTMANGLGLATVAEGVENAEQDAMLRELSCDMVQGNFHGRPQSAAGIRNLVQVNPLRLKAVPTS